MHDSSFFYYFKKDSWLSSAILQTITWTLLRFQKLIKNSSNCSVSTLSQILRIHQETEMCIRLLLSTWTKWNSTNISKNKTKQKNMKRDRMSITGYCNYFYVSQHFNNALLIIKTVWHYQEKLQIKWILRLHCKPQQSTKNLKSETTGKGVKWNNHLAISTIINGPASFNAHRSLNLRMSTHFLLPCWWDWEA